jgi:hypothetical protein
MHQRFVRIDLIPDVMYFGAAGADIPHGVTHLEGPVFLSAYKNIARLFAWPRWKVPPLRHGYRELRWNFPQWQLSHEELSEEFDEDVDVIAKHNIEQHSRYEINSFEPAVILAVDVSKHKHGFVYGFSPNHLKEALFILRSHDGKNLLPVIDEHRYEQFVRIMYNSKSVNEAISFAKSKHNRKR